MVYSLLRAPITNCHNCSGLKHMNLFSYGSGSFSPDCPQLAETRQKPAELGVGTATDRGAQLLSHRRERLRIGWGKDWGVENNSTYPCLGVYMENISFLKDLS